MQVEIDLILKGIKTARKGIRLSWQQGECVEIDLILKGIKTAACACVHSVIG